jgi:hypothetical protein
MELRQIRAVYKQIPYNYITTLHPSYWPLNTLLIALYLETYLTRTHLTYKGNNLS